jgi:agmatine deiminase
VYNEILAVLQQSTDAKARKFEIHLVIEPDLGCLGSSVVAKAPATNDVDFHFVSGSVILSHFGDKDLDEKALDFFRRLCPDWIVWPVQVRALPSCGGVIHCARQQVINVASELKVISIDLLSNVCKIVKFE